MREWGLGCKRVVGHLRLFSVSRPFPVRAVWVCGPQPCSHTQAKAVLSAFQCAICWHFLCSAAAAAVPQSVQHVMGQVTALAWALKLDPNLFTAGPEVLNAAKDAFTLAEREETLLLHKLVGCACGGFGGGGAAGVHAYSHLHLCVCAQEGGGWPRFRGFGGRGVKVWWLDAARADTGREGGDTAA